MVPSTITNRDHVVYLSAVQEGAIMTGIFRIATRARIATSACFLVVFMLNIRAATAAGSSSEPSSVFWDYLGNGIISKAYINAIPSGQFLVCGWARCNESFQTWGKGNDYPFYIDASGSGGRGIWCISGNLITADLYNQNTTLYFDGDRNTVYLPVTLSEALGWVFVAWHFRNNGSKVVIKQYSKFGVDGNLTLNSTDSGTAVTHTGIWLGSNAHDLSKGINVIYARVYEMAAPTTNWLNSVALNPDADPTAWADWSLVNYDTTDRSGHGRNLTLGPGTLQTGYLGPAITGSSTGTMKGSEQHAVSSGGARSLGRPTPFVLPDEGYMMVGPYDLRGRVNGFFANAYERVLRHSLPIDKR
jgi:hypothetical protein